MRTKTSSAMSATGPSSTAKRAWTMTGTAMSTTSTAGISSILLLIRWDRTASRRSNTAHVAGTIAAENGNGIGVCGVAGGRGGHSGVRVISCQMFTENRNDNGDEIVALKYGADAGAVISQNSWGYTNVYEMPEITKDAIDYFIEYAGLDENGVQVGPMKGGIVIFAAGNEERDYRSYPACYERVLSVSALAPDYRKSYYSNFSEWIDVAAPGGSYKYEGRYGDEYAVYSTLPGNAYGYMQGTSMACPHVSGIAALAVAKYGGPGFTPDKLRSYLERGVHEVDSYNPDYEGRLGSGLVDAYLAVSMDRGHRSRSRRRSAAQRYGGRGRTDVERSGRRRRRTRRFVHSDVARGNIGKSRSRRSARGGGIGRHPRARQAGGRRDHLRADRYRRTDALHGGPSSPSILGAIVLRRRSFPSARRPTRRLR